ncbi:hypothetical protein GCM10027589_41840 [Actinocorallia lasiicapitis]
MASIGFRATERDKEILRTVSNPGESISDVIRRALLLLEREHWHAQAQRDADRIVASGEDLNAEPDAW